MPFCGFSQEMLEGIEKFHKGLVEHGILERSEKKRQTTEQTITKEIKDMKEFLKEIHNIKDGYIRTLTEALVKYACAYYEFVQKNGVNNHKQIIQFLNRFYSRMDNKYYSELENKPNAMQKLALYLNEIGKIK